MRVSSATTSQTFAMCSFLIVFSFLKSEMRLSELKKSESIFFINFSFDLIYFLIFHSCLITFEQKKINVWAGAGWLLFTIDERI